MPNPKGKVYGAIVVFPSHPDASLNGEVRVVIRTNMFSLVIHALATYGVEVLPRDLGRNWAISESHAEAQATEQHFGQVLACPVSLAYLSPAAYSLIPEGLKLPPAPTTITQPRKAKR